MRRLARVITCLLLLSGCASRTGEGALIGGALGGGTGLLLDGWEGALAGTALGAGAGALLGSAAEGEHHHGNHHGSCKHHCYDND